MIWAENPKPKDDAVKCLSCDAILFSGSGNEMRILWYFCKYGSNATRF